MACLAACLILTVSASADAYIKREMRATWMTTSLSLDWPSQKGTSATIIQAQKQEAITYLDELKKTNINTVLSRFDQVAMLSTNQVTNPGQNI